MTSTTNAHTQVVDRLISGSMRRSYDSLVDIDWEAPQDPDVFYMPPEVISLYGTPLWEQMSHRQRVELSRQEAANVMSRATWFENTLNQGLLMVMLHQDPTSRHVHYALTELGDETRHMIMFGKGVAAIGVQPYRLSRLEALAVQLFPIAYRGLMLWVAALTGEEILDNLQREYASHPDLQPIVAQIMQIHVVEEARHIRFAREGVRQRIARSGRIERVLTATLHGAGGFVMRRMFYNRDVYARCGLDVNEAMAQARANEAVNARRRAAFAPLAAFLEEDGLMNPVSRWAWRKFGFLA